MTQPAPRTANAVPLASNRTFSPRLGVALGLLLLLAVALPLIVSPFVVGVLVLAFLAAYLATAWNVIGGIAGQLSLVHGALFAAGGYVSTLLYLHLGVTPWLGALASAVVTGLIGAAIGGVVFRYRVKGTYFALVTLAVSELLRVVVVHNESLGGARGFQLPLSSSWVNFQFATHVPYYYTALFLLVAGIAVTAAIRNSRLGLFLTAVRESEPAAQASGINSNYYKSVAMVISAAMVGVGGTFYVQFMRFIQPEMIFSLNYTIQMLLSSLVGGIGTVAGPVIGSFLLSGLQQAIQLLPMGSRVVASSTQIFYGAAVFFIVLKLPNGVASLWGRRRAALRNAQPH